MSSDQRTSPVKFVSPHGWRNKSGRLLWNSAHMLLFRPSLSPFGAWRRSLLSCFGARIGRAWLHPSVRIWAPWKLTIGDDVYIDRQVNLYSTFGIEIGDRVIISMGTVLCTPSHNHRDPAYALTGGPIKIGNDCWISAEAFVLPGVTIGEGAVVAARAVVTKNVEPWTVVAGNPARCVGKRNLTRDAR